MTNEIAIVAAKRTALGSFGGSLKSVSAVQLGETVCKNILSESKLDPVLVDEVIFGNVLHAGLGQNVARQIAVNSGIPVQVPAFTIDMVCGSGLKAVELGVQKIKCGDAQIVLAGGTENMSQAPYVLEKHRWGSRMGNDIVVDTMIRDGLSDAFKGYHMGITAENVAEKYGLSREEQDQFAYESQQKAVAAIKAGKFVDEIVPVEVATRKETYTFDTDEYPRESTNPEKLAHLRPAFKPEGGTVTAGNASGLNDGAAAVLLMTREKAKELDLPILATVVSCASAGVDPSIMGCGPIPASQKALAKAQLSIEDMNLVEANEAFASQALAVMRDLKLDPNIVNVNGGAIALGHPIGASGARILVTLIHEMMKRESTYGLATLCIGGGQGEAVVIKRGKEN